MAVQNSFEGRPAVTWTRISKVACGCTVAALVAFAPLSMASPARAQNAPTDAPAVAQPQLDKDIQRRELKNFDRYLDRHPKVAKALRKDPSLVNDSNFLAKHTSLQKFLTKHPAARDALRDNPQAFMKQEKRIEKRESHHHKTKS